MSAKTTTGTKTTHNAGFPPAPSEAHQRAKGYASHRPGVKGDTHSIVLDVSRLHLKHNGQQWLVEHTTNA